LRENLILFFEVFDAVKKLARGKKFVLVDGVGCSSFVGKYLRLNLV